MALGVIGPIAAGLASKAVAPDGSGQHTLLSGASLGSGIVALLCVGLLVAAMGILGGLLAGRREGLLCMGFVLGWVAWTSGQLGRVYQLSAESGTLVMLAIETALLILVILIVGAIISMKDESDSLSSFAPRRLVGWMSNKAMLGAMLSAFVAAGVMAWLFGQIDLPGQSIGVAFIASIIAGVVGAMVAASLSDEKHHTGTPYAPVMIGVMLCGVIAPIVGIFKPGIVGLGELALLGDLPGYLVVSPAAWIGGALIGVPVGHSWVEHSHAHVDQTAQTAS